MSTKTVPFIEKEPSILNKPDGSVLFECMVQSGQPPEIKWFHKGKELAAGDKHVIRMKKTVGKYACTLIIKNPVQSDQGIYKIQATNPIGSSDKEQDYVMMCTGNSMYPE